METNSDKALAVAGSLAVHALVLVVLWLGLLHQPAELRIQASEGPSIEASLVSTPQQVAAAIRRIENEPKPAPLAAAPPPQPKPEPHPQDAPQPQQLTPQARLPKPDTVDQEEVRRAAELASQIKHEQDERHKQAQIDLTRQQEQLEAENRQRLAQQQLEKDKQLADIRKQKAEADRQVKLQEQKYQQLADAAAHNTPAPMPHPAAAAASSQAVGTNLQARYLEAIRNVVNMNWRHEGVPERVHCIVHFKQLPGGEVFGDATFGDCPFDAQARVSIQEALHRTPLPFKGFESVFAREGTIDMCYPEEACK